MNQRGNIPPYALLQWCSDVNCHLELTKQMFLLSIPHICLQQYEMREIMFHADYYYKE